MRWWLFGTLLGLLLALDVYLYVAPRPIDPGVTERVEHAAERVRAGDEGVWLRLDEVDGEPYDRLHVFGPYTTADVVEQRAGVRSHRFRRLAPGGLRGETRQLLVAMRGRQPVAAVRLSTTEVTFCLASPVSVAAREATFRLRRDSGTVYAVPADPRLRGGGCPPFVTS